MRKDLLFGEAAQNLAKIANLDTAGGSRIRLFTVFALKPESFSLVEASFGECHIVAQSVSQQIIAQLAEIVAPAYFSGDSGSVTEVGRVHQLEILLILCGSARGDLVDPLAEMATIGSAEFRKSIEEMIVPRHSW